LDYFQLGAIMNNAAKHIYGVSLHEYLFSLLLRSSRISRSYDKYIFDFERNAKSFSYHSLFTGFLFVLFFPLLLSNLFF